MASQTENLTTAQPEARKENAQKSTGPRTAAGKRRSSQNARKHGLYSNANFFWDAAIALGEDPREFGRLLKGLVLARQPADTLEMVLVEDIALIIWKKARLDRAEAAVQVCNLQKHDLERRKQFVQVGRDISDTLQSEVREKGLRTTLDAPGKFEQILSVLDILVEMVEKNDFSSNMQEFLRGVYGEEPTLRGAGLYNNYWKLSEMKPGNQEFEDAKTLMRARLAEEISDVAQQYELFLHEHVENTRAARMAATAPSHAQWAAIIRQQNALHRQLEHKIRLLEEVQEKRKREERVLDNCEASSRRNPSGAPRGGGRTLNQKKILNRGNEPKTLLKTQELSDTASSKRTPFCPGKSAIKAKKRGISVQEARGTGDSPAAGSQSQDRSGGCGYHWRGVGGFKPQSFPRKACPELAEGRESTRQTFEDASTNWIPAFAGMTGVSRGLPCPASWIPAFAGMTSVSRGIPSQMASPPSGGAGLICRATGRSRMPRNSLRAKGQVCVTCAPPRGLRCVIVSRLVERLGSRIRDSGFRIQE